MDEMKKLREQVIKDLRRTLIWILIACGVSYGAFFIMGM